LPMGTFITFAETDAGLEYLKDMTGLRGLSSACSLVSINYKYSPSFLSQFSQSLVIPHRAIRCFLYIPAVRTGGNRQEIPNSENLWYNFLSEQISLF
jgi:hypothetical protein